MISREWAVELVERQLLAWWESGGSVAFDEPFVVAHVEQHEFGWYIVYNSRQFVETGDRMFALGGNAPFVVDGLDGSLHQVAPWMCEDFDWAGQYREKVRGEAPPRALDVEVGRLVGLGRRSDALKAVRAAGDFGPDDVQRYVDAVVAGSGPDPEPEGWSAGGRPHHFPSS